MCGLAHLESQPVPDQLSLLIFHCDKVRSVAGTHSEIPRRCQMRFGVWAGSNDVSSSGLLTQVPFVLVSIFLPTPHPMFPGRISPDQWRRRLHEIPYQYLFPGRISHDPSRRFLPTYYTCRHAPTLLRSEALPPSRVVTPLPLATSLPSFNMAYDEYDNDDIQVNGGA